MNKYTSLIVQEQALKSYFPNGKVKRWRERELTWRGIITPNALSAAYTIELHYLKGVPKVYVINPTKLPLAEGKSKLPHVYDHDKQQLCLYYPKAKEWNPKRLFVHTIIPWASEWLLHYELWVCTGIWSGGGIEHPEPKTTLKNEEA